MSVVALVIAPSIALDIVEVADYSKEKAAMEVVVNEISKEVKVEMFKNDDGTVKATVTTTSTENGKVLTDVKIIEGTEKEVEDKLSSKKLDSVKVKVEKIIIEEVIK